MNWINKQFQGDLLTVAPAPSVICFIDAGTDEDVMIFLANNPMDVTMSMDGEVISCPDATHYVRGSGIAMRDVWHFITRKHCKHLRAGLTVHRSAFSSTPHDFELTPERDFEEVFCFLISGDGKALLEGDGMWPDGQRVDAAWPARNGDFAQVPMGRHRVTALADAEGGVPLVGYVWCYLCLKDEWEK